MIKICHWVITKRCNLKCIHCIASTGSKRELNTKKALEVLNSLYNLGCKKLYITGGEPLIRTDIFEILKEAKRKKMKLALLTNGLLLNNQTIYFLKKYVDEIGISIDGSSSKINDQIRGSKTFKKIIKAISILKTYKIPITLYITINKINYSDFGDILKLVRSLKIPNIRVNEISLRGRAYKNRKYLSINNYPNNTTEKYLLNSLKSNLGSDFKKHLRMIYNKNCGADLNTIVLSPTGYIYPCIEILQKCPEHHFGSILNFTSERMQKYGYIVSNTSISQCPYKTITGKTFSICLNKPKINCCLIPFYANQKNKNIKTTIPKVG